MPFQSAFQHGNRRKAPAHALSQETKQHITSLYRSKYDIANINHILAVIHTRTIDSGQAIKYCNNYYTTYSKSY
ncbi:hypothetical protein AwErysi_03900 [Erysipelotrichaceae bacterium]|nr:hypothetical protein AwErysi_03900 [Erysipelotrichaceae bacterium]